MIHYRKLVLALGYLAVTCMSVEGSRGAGDIMSVGGTDDQVIKDRYRSKPDRHNDDFVRSWMPQETKPRNVTECTCGPGEYVKTTCINSQRALCEPCPKGKYSSYTDEATSCADCTFSCPQNAFPERGCTSKNNTLCKCKPGYGAHYALGDGLSCLRACYCGPGYYVKTICSNTSSAICERCGNGTYSRSFNADTFCTDCTYTECPLNAVRESECAPEHDIVCKCKPGYKVHGKNYHTLSCLEGATPSTTVSPKDETSIKGNGHNSKDEVHPYRIGVSIMSLMVLIYITG